MLSNNRKKCGKCTLIHQNVVTSDYLTSNTSLIIIIIFYNYNIHNTVLKETNTIKYVGVHIDDKLTWKSHVNTIVAKANSVKGFLSWNFKHCPPSVKNKCYQTLIRPVLEYASIVWSPYLAGYAH